MTLRDSQTDSSSEDPTIAGLPRVETGSTVLPPKHDSGTGFSSEELTLGANPQVDEGWTLLPDIPDDPRESILDTMVRPNRSPLTLDPAGARDIPRLSILATQDTGSTDPENLPPPPSDGYSILALVASGGCGEVWMARQNSLGRVVALKAIKGSLHGQMDSGLPDMSIVERSFRIEARVTAQLEHPNIVPVYDLGTDDLGNPVMAMKLVRGMPWSEVLAQDFESLQPEVHIQKHLTILLSVMQAVAFAHARGIVHRDLKPAQVMLGEFGEVLLMDWGLAVAMDPGESGESEPARINLANQVAGLPTPRTAVNPCGTPCYMAPEQARTTAEHISRQTDVYLLGGILYEILTGRPPRRSSNSRETIRLAAQGHVDPITATPGRAIPDELRRICERALDPDPSRRPAGVGDLRRSIEIYLSGESERAQAQTILQEVEARFNALVGPGDSSRRGIDPATTYSVCAECLSELARASYMSPRLSGLPQLRARIIDHYASAALREGDLRLASGLATLIEDPKERSVIQARIAEQERAQQRQRTQRRLMVAGLIILIATQMAGSYMYLALEQRTSERLAIERDTATAAQAQAERARQLAADLRERAEVDQYHASITAAEVSLGRQRGDTAARLLLDATQPHLRGWEWGVLARRILGDRFTLAPADLLPSAVWSPNRPLIYSGSRDGSLHIFDAPTGRYLDAYKYFAGRLYDARPSPDGRRILLTSFDNYALVVDAADGRILARLRGHEGLIREGTWSASGELAITGSFDKTAILWNTRTGTAIRSFAGFDKVVNGGRFGPGDRTVLLFSDDGQSRIVNVERGTVEATLTTAGPPIHYAVYLPDFTRVAAVDGRGYLHLFDAATGNPIYSRQVSDLPVNVICHLDKGRTLAMVDEVGRGTLVDTNTGEPFNHFVLADSYPRTMEESPDGRFLAVAGRFSIRVYDLAPLLLRTQQLPAHPWDPVRTPPDFRLKVYGLTTGRDPLWNQMERKWNPTEGVTLLQQGGRTIAVEGRYDAFSPDGRYRFQMDPQSLRGRVMETATGRVVWPGNNERLATGIFSPDGRWLAVVNPLDRIHLIDTATWTVSSILNRYPPNAPVIQGLDRYIVGEVCFSPDSSSLAVAYLNGRMILWNLSTGQPQFETERLNGVGASVAFRPDAKEIVTGGNDDRIAIWDGHNGKLLRTFTGHQRPIMGAAYSPDGNRLVTFARDRSVRIWDPNRGRELMTVYESPPGTLTLGAQFTKDGKALALILSDGTVQIHESMPWNEHDYPTGDLQTGALPTGTLPTNGTTTSSTLTDGSTLTLRQRIELHNRRQMLGNQVTVDDLIHRPQTPTANFRR